MTILGSPTRLIARHGNTVTYTRVLAGTYNPSTNEYTQGASSSSSIKAFPTQNRFRDTQLPNLIGKKIKTYLISAEDIAFTPDRGDIIVDGSESLEVKEVVAHSALGTIAVWRLVVTKA